MKKILWKKKSRYALVTCFENGRGLIVEKEIAPEKVNLKNARWVNESSMYFRQKLRLLGVKLAEPYTFCEVEGKAIQTSPFVGLDLDEIFHRGGATPLILQRLFSTIGGVLMQVGREVGIDARLSNFCVTPDGSVIYVDTFPPLVKYQGGYIVHFPNPTDPAVVEQELRRKFDPFGIMRRIRFSILAQDAGVTQADILSAVGKVVGGNFQADIDDFFHTLPDNKEERVALAELSLDDPDAIRELALRFMPPKGPARHAYFSKVFDLSSNFCPLNITDDERLGCIRELFVRS